LICFHPNLLSIDPDKNTVTLSKKREF